MRIYTLFLLKRIIVGWVMSGNPVESKSCGVAKLIDQAVNQSKSDLTLSADRNVTLDAQREYGIGARGRHTASYLGAGEFSRAFDETCKTTGANPVDAAGYFYKEVAKRLLDA